MYLPCELRSACGNIILLSPRFILHYSQLIFPYLGRMSFAARDGLLLLNEKQYDFSVQLEQLLFSIISTTLFIATSPWRVFHQVRKPIVVDAAMFQLIETVSCVHPEDV